MKKFKIGGHYGLVGSEWQMIIEAENYEAALSDAEDIMKLQIEIYAEEIEEENG